MQSCSQDSTLPEAKGAPGAPRPDEDVQDHSKGSLNRLNRYYERPRAVSAAVAPTISGQTQEPESASPESSRGRLVASWLSWKRAWDLKRAAEGSAPAPADPARRAKPHSGRNAPAKRHRDRHHVTMSSSAIPQVTRLDAAVTVEETRSADDNAIREALEEERVGVSRSVQPRKVVSLLLRRKSSRPPAPSGQQQHGSLSRQSDAGKRSCEQGVVERLSPKQKGFRRVRSQLHPPVSKSSGGEGGRYLEYAAELDDDSFERLVEFTKHLALDRESLSISDRAEESDTVPNTSPDASEPTDGEIIGEIRLEDYAEISDDEDLDFLNDAESGELGSCDVSNRAGSRGVRMDNQKLRWVGNEAEFAAFFADFGFDVPLENSPSEVHAADFDVGPDILEEWAKFICDHNESCRAWSNCPSNRSSNLDIRTLAWD